MKLVGTNEGDSLEKKDETREKEGAEGKKEEKTEEQQKEEAIRHEAMRQTREHFEGKISAFSVFLETDKAKPAIEAVLELMKSGETLTKELVLKTLQHPEKGEPINDGDFLEVIIMTLPLIKPVQDLPQAYELFKQLASREQTQKWLIEKTNESAKNFSEGTSWYHTTEEGSNVLRNIQNTLLTSK